jgi:hypothetical protein
LVPPKADPLRVSQTVKQMMANDGGDYQKNDSGKGDYHLLSKDQELIFSKDKNERNVAAADKNLFSGDNEPAEQIQAGRNVPLFDDMGKLPQVR